MHVCGSDLCFEDTDEVPCSANYLNMFIILTLGRDVIIVFSWRRIIKGEYMEKCNLAWQDLRVNHVLKSLHHALIHNLMMQLLLS